MRVQRIHIEQFGIFSAQKAEGLSCGLNVFLGNNEAGKSTLLHFFRAMFFGYKSKGQGNFDYAFGSKGGGGVLALTTAQGQPFTLSRRPGTHGGPFELHGDNGAPLPQEMLSALLGGYTAALYDQVFCFGLRELSSLQGMDEKRVSDVLHAAAFGLGFKSPFDVLKTLDARQEPLYAPKGGNRSNRTINIIFKRLEAIEDELRSAGSEFSRYAALSLERENLQDRLKVFEKETVELRKNLERAQSLAGAWDEWLRLKECETLLTLAPCPEGEFGVDSLSRLEALAARVDAQRALMAARNALHEKTLVAIDEAGIYLPLAAIWPSCQNLQSSRGNIAAAFEKLPVLKRRAEELELQQGAHLRRLGGDWPLDKALRFEDSLLVRKDVANFRARLTAAERALEQTAHDERRLAEELAEARRVEAAQRYAYGQPVVEELHQDETEFRYSLEAREQIRQKGQLLAGGGEKLRELAQLQARQEHSAREADSMRMEHQVRLKEMERELAPDAECVFLRDKLADFSVIYTDKARLLSALTEARARLAQERPPLLGPHTARQDTRRVPFMLASMLLAILCLHGAYDFFGRTGLGQSVADKLLNAREWQFFLERNWLMFFLGLAFIWFTLYWLSPRVATLGRHAFRPDALRLALENLERDFTAKTEAMYAALREITGLPIFKALAPWYNKIQAESEAEARFLYDAIPRLEAALRVQEVLRGRAAAAAEALQAEEERVRILKRELELSTALTDDERLNQEQRIALWDMVVLPYGLAAGCELETVLRIFDLGAHVSGVSKKYLAALTNTKKAVAHLETVREEWHAWLEAHDFSCGFDPDTLPSALESISEISSLARAIDETREESDRLTQGIIRFAAELTSLREAAGLPADLADISKLALLGQDAAERVLRSFDAVYAAASGAHAETARMHDREKELESLEADILEQKTLLAAQEDSLFALLNQGRSKSVEEYGLHFEQFMEYARLRRQREQSMALLTRHASGLFQPGSVKLWDGLPEFFEALEGSSLEVLNGHVDMLAEKLKEAVLREKEGHTRAGAIAATLEALGSGQEGARLRAEESALKDELAALARQWTVYALAKGFIRKARRNFEEERHDSVIRLAGELFYGMTAGRYKNLRFDLGDKHIKAFAVAEDGRGLDSDIALSQGTREQLYLALRLAFIKQHNLTKESLPLIMDDILVNFDPERAENTAAMLAEFSAANQSLFFTCHPHTAELLCKSGSGAELYHIEKGKISKA